MPLSIRNPTAEKLARQVSSELNMTITQTIIVALEHEMLRVKGRKREPDALSEILAISRRCSALPDLDTRSVDEIFGYDESGIIPHGD